MSEEKKEERPQGEPTPPAATPAKSTAEGPGAKPAHGAPPAPAGPVGEPWSGELVEALRKTFPDMAFEALTYRGQNYLVCPSQSILPLMLYLKSECAFNMLADLTVVDYPKREKRFELIYQLYSFSRNERLRLKAPLGENETVESVVPVWGTADWLEREVFDMFGIRFDHHPNLRRILLPEEWQGHPLRKDYGIFQQDAKWVQENLHIESGQ